MLVRDVMTEDPAFVEGSDPISVAIDLLNDLDVRHLPVVEGDEVIGILSDRDIRNYDLPLVSQTEEDAAEFEEILVSSVMSADSYIVGPEDDLSEVIQLMIDQKFGAIPVVDPIEGKLTGIVSYIDILRVCLDYID